MTEASAMAGHATSFETTPDGAARPAVTPSTPGSAAASPRAASLPTATLRETVQVLADVIVPNVAKGVIIRRRRAKALIERFDLDRRGIRRVQQLHEKYGDGPLLFHLPIGPYALILAPNHVHRVLAGAPVPFTANNRAKRASLARFEPLGVLLSDGPERADRRRFNEAVLDTDLPIHRYCGRFLAVVEEEVSELIKDARRHGRLEWEPFTAAWARIVRRVVLGDGARDDLELSRILDTLRSDGNWTFMRPMRKGLRRKFFERLRRHAERAEPESLAGAMASVPATSRTAPLQQIPQWLFAADAAGVAMFRALALLATHPEQAARFRRDAEAAQGPARALLPYARACVLDSLRLWPTTPLLLRDSVEPTTWTTSTGDNATLPAKTGVLIYAPYFHRDDRRLPYADRFEPELWLEERTAEDWPLIPFSAGPSVCAGRNLVLLLTSATLTRLLDGRQIRLEGPRRVDPSRPLPATIDHFTLRFALDG